MEIKWNKLAVKQLVDAIQYLEENELIDYAKKVEKDILSKIKSITKNFALYQLDSSKETTMVAFMLLKLTITEYLIVNYQKKLGF